jgi:polyisoprenoid-binding protein YceI
MEAADWEIDEMHSAIRFSVRHMVVGTVRGEFKRWTVSVNTADEAFENVTLEVRIDASSIDTGVAGRDAHLKSGDFFDTHRFPEIVFRCRRVERVDLGRLRAFGELTIRDVTREIVLEVRDDGRTIDSSGHEHAGFTATASLDRRDFGMAWNDKVESAGIIVGNRIDVDIDVEAIKRRAISRESTMRA